MRNDSMSAPIAEKEIFSFQKNGKIIQDEYAWLRDSNWPEVKNQKILSYLQKENSYSEQFFNQYKDDRDKIFEELKSRIKLDDQSPPVKKDNFYYYTRTEADKNYPIYCRKYGSMHAQEEILLDVNKLAKDKKFAQICSFSVSPDHSLIAYSVDFAGNEKYTIKVFNTKTQSYLSDEIENTIGQIIWHEEVNGFFYTPTNDNWRHDKVMFHLLGKNEDKLIFHEVDQLFQVQVMKSSSKEYIFIYVEGHSGNEIHFIKMSDPDFTPYIIAPRTENIYYHLEHNGDKFFIHTNKEAKNFQVLVTSIDNYTQNFWQSYTLEIKDHYLTSIDITKNYMILNYRFKGLPLIKILKLEDKTTQTLNFPDQAYSASSFSTNFEEDDVRVKYSSLARPDTIYNYNFGKNELSILKITEIPSGFNPDEYVVERLWANSEEVEVPITIFYKKSLFKKNGENPLYLYGYGSYGISIPVTFRNSAVTLADRGFVFAIAHIRGGDELGFEWYESAKFLNKKRTFADFIACSKYLINNNYTSKGNIVVCGGSAGGLLIGNVINERPELFKAAIAHVPFVDVLNTMLDESLPLTPGEFKEWGNPKEPEYFDYMLSYSPYDNIKKQDYPHLFVTAGLTDPRVGYWEAAKWVARLRNNKTDNNLLILKTNMDSGHQGASGRFDYLKEVAEDYVFIFKVFGIAS